MSQTPRYLFSGLASLWMDGFSVSLSQMIPHVYDRLLDGSGFEYLQVCAFGTPLVCRLESISLKAQPLDQITLDTFTIGDPDIGPYLFETFRPPIMGQI